MANRAITRLMANLKHSNRALGEVIFGGRYQRQLGLFSDDYLPETPEVLEALRRMPLGLQDERTFRIMRALDLSGQKQVLPKDQWVKPEDDVSYIRPYLEQVMKEKREQEEWNKQL